MDKDQKYNAAAELKVEKAKNLPYGTLEAIIATDDLDRHNEHVSIKGMKIDKSRTYKVYYNHQTYGDALPIGKYEKIWKKGNQLWGRFKLAVEEYDFADKIYRLVKGGYLDSMSVGFIPKEFDAETSTWTMSDFMEGSIVAEPANVMATIESKSFEFSKEDFETSEKKFVKLKAENEEPEAEEATEVEKAIQQIEALETKEELEAVHESFKAKAAAVGIAVKELTQNPTEANVRRVKMHLRSIKGEADTMSHVVKVKLKEK